jgi:hypothetical protein
LVANPCKRRLVVHQRLLTETSRNVKQIELRRLRESCIRYQPQAAYVAHRLERLAEDSVGSVRNAREDLERAVKSIWSKPSNNSEPIWSWASCAITAATPRIA